jgi:putative DNA primase/helicase
MVILGRTLPTPRTVELIAKALTGRVPTQNPQDASWWYPMVERRVCLGGDQTAPLAMERHVDPIAEAVRWSICEGELIQAMGRGRGVNRTAHTPLEIDLLADVVLPVTVNALVPWSDIRPTRHDLMALQGIVLENAADMAACFPDLWPSPVAARQDRSRSVTNCYYRDLYNSQMSHSCAQLTYRPEGAGHRARTAQVNLSRIHDPEAWLTNRLGPLASFKINHIAGECADLPDPANTARLDALACRLTDSMQAVLAGHRFALDALSARLEAAKPSDLPHPHQPPKEIQP